MDDNRITLAYWKLWLTIAIPVLLSSIMTAYLFEDYGHKKGRDSLAEELCEYHNARMIKHVELEAITCRTDTPASLVTSSTTFMLINKHNATWERVDRQ